MRTSVSQFELMVDYMERNGDLSKPQDRPNGRMANHRSWAELANSLNMDASGDSKTVEKWKKVWSDLKNNTKKKAAKINRSAGGTGGGPALKLTLSDLEQRVLNIVGAQAATGLAGIAEVGVETNISTSTIVPSNVSPLPATQNPELEDDGRILSSSPRIVIEVVDEIVTPTTHHAQTPIPREMFDSQPGPPRPNMSPRRRRRNNPIRRHHDAAAQFLESDREWRSLFQNISQEQLRVREIELQQQQQWQILFNNLMNLMEKIIEKLNQ